MSDGEPILRLALELYSEVRHTVLERRRFTAILVIVIKH
jgi:hypothetical protein